MCKSAVTVEQHLFMVDIFLPESLNPEFLRLIPAQRFRIDELMREGKIGSYSLSLDRSRLWVLCYAREESEVLGLLRSMPIFDFIRYRIHPLMFHNEMNFGWPAVSMN